MVSEKFTSQSKIKSIMEEFMDILETEYVESIFHDAIHFSVVKYMREFIIKQLQRP